MIALDGDTLRVSGAITMDTVPGLVAAGIAHLSRGVVRVDLSGVTEADSAAVALALAWTRAARRRRTQARDRGHARVRERPGAVYAVDSILGAA